MKLKLIILTYIYTYRRLCFMLYMLENQSLVSSKDGQRQQAIGLLIFRASLPV